MRTQLHGDEDRRTHRPGRAPPYPEYHTSDDNPSIIQRERLEESRDLILKVLEIMDSDFVPVRQFRGPAFLSRYGPWVDWRQDWNRNMAIDLIMLLMDGTRSVFALTETIIREFEIPVDYDWVRFVSRMIDKGLVRPTPLANG